MTSSPFYDPLRYHDDFERGRLELRTPEVERVKVGTDIAIPKRELEDWYYVLDGLRDSIDDDEIVELRDRIYRYLP